MPRVLDDIAEGGKLIVALGAVHAIIHSDKVNIVLREHDFGIHTHLQIVTAETGHILDDNTLDDTCLNIGDHFLKPRTVERRTRNTVVDIKSEVGVSVFKSVLLQDFLLERNLSRVFSLLKHSICHAANNCLIFSLG